MVIRASMPAGKFANVTVNAQATISYMMGVALVTLCSSGQHMKP
jgi:hypothetical protein